MLGIAQNITATWGTNDAPLEWSSHIDLKEPNKIKKAQLLEVCQLPPLKILWSSEGNSCCLS